MRGKVTRVVRSQYAKVGQMYFVNEALLRPDEAYDGEEGPGLCIVIWDDDDAYEQATKLIGEEVILE